MFKDIALLEEYYNILFPYIFALEIVLIALVNYGGALEDFIWDSVSLKKQVFKRMTDADKSSKIVFSFYASESPIYLKYFLTFIC